MARKLIITISLFIFIVSGAFAVDVTATLPSLFYEGDLIDVGDFDITDVTAPAEENLKIFDSMNRLTQAFGNANSYAADAATTRGLMGYRFITVAAGTMIGLQFPDNDFTAIDDSLSRIEKEGDAYFGAALQGITVSVGVNAGLLVDGLYLTGKAGRFNMDTDDLTFDSSVFGLLANYQIINPRSLLGAVRWRGVQAGAGLVYYTSTSSFNVASETVEVTKEITHNGITEDATLFLDPSFKAEVTSSGFKVPLDLITGIRLLWVANLNFGVGMDLNLGSRSEVSYTADGRTYFGGDIMEVGDVTQTPGSVTIKGGTKGDGAELMRLRAMAGFGIGVGPLKIDIPFTYYFDDEGPGVNLGITGAVTL